MLGPSRSDWSLHRRPHGTSLRRPQTPTPRTPLAWLSQRHHASVAGAAAASPGLAHLRFPKRGHGPTRPSLHIQYTSKELAAVHDGLQPSRSCACRPQSSPASANRRRFWHLKNLDIRCMREYSLKMTSCPRVTFTLPGNSAINAPSLEFVSE